MASENILLGRRTALPMVYVTDEWVSGARCTLHAVHSRIDPETDTKPLYSGFARFVSDNTADFARRLNRFKMDNSGFLGTSLITISEKLGITINMFSEMRLWQTHLRQTLIELPKILPPGTIISMPLIGTGLWKGKPKDLWKVFQSLPQDYPIFLSVSDPRKQLAKLVTLPKINTSVEYGESNFSPKYPAQSFTLTGQTSPLFSVWSVDLPFIKKFVSSVNNIQGAPGPDPKLPIHLETLVYPLSLVMTTILLLSWGFVVGATITLVLLLLTCRWLLLECEPLNLGVVSRLFQQVQNFDLYDKIYSKFPSRTIFKLMAREKSISPSKISPSSVDLKPSHSPPHPDPVCETPSPPTFEEFLKRGFVVGVP